MFLPFAGAAAPSPAEPLSSGSVAVLQLVALRAV